MRVRIASVRLLPTVYAAGKASLHGSAQVARQGKRVGATVESGKDFRQVALITSTMTVSVPSQLLSGVARVSVVASAMTAVSTNGSLFSAGRVSVRSSCEQADRMPASKRRIIRFKSDSRFILHVCFYVLYLCHRRLRNRQATPFCSGISPCLRRIHGMAVVSFHWNQLISILSPSPFVQSCIVPELITKPVF